MTIEFKKEGLTAIFDTEGPILHAHYAIYVTRDDDDEVIYRTHLSHNLGKDPRKERCPALVFDYLKGMTDEELTAELEAVTLYAINRVMKIIDVNERFGIKDKWRRTS